MIFVAGRLSAKHLSKNCRHANNFARETKPEQPSFVRYPPQLPIVPNHSALPVGWTRSLFYFRAQVLVKPIAEYLQIFRGLPKIAPAVTFARAHHQFGNRGTGFPGPLEE